jgi:hypothetical protein
MDNKGLVEKKTIPFTHTRLRQPVDLFDRAAIFEVIGVVESMEECVGKKRELRGVPSFLLPSEQPTP